MEQTFKLQFTVESEIDFDSATKQQIKDILLKSLTRNRSFLSAAERKLAQALLVGPYTPECGTGCCELPEGHEGPHASKW